MDSILEKLQRVPQEPGVYLFKDHKQKILYVGKAKKLKTRLMNYFRDSKSLELKTKSLMVQVHDFDIIIVHTEVEALLLERSLIRDHNPPYNILLRDDKEFPYIKIDYQNPWPRIRKVRKRDDKKATYLGPFADTSGLNLILEQVYKVFPLVRCTEYEFQNTKRPCNYYHMKQCLAPCTKEVDRDTYLQIMKSAEKMILGQNHEIISELKKKMKEKSINLDFEQALVYRELISALETTRQEQSVILDPKFSADILGFSSFSKLYSFHILMVREGKIVGQKQLQSEVTFPETDEALESFIVQFYNPDDLPDKIITPILIANQDNLNTYFHHGQYFIKQAISKDEKRLSEMACKNAKYAGEEYLQEKNKRLFAMQAIKKDLHLSELPYIMDCIDISHFQGKYTVASCVRFRSGKPDPKSYRLYNLGIDMKPDDYQCIYDVVSRRLSSLQKEDDLPNLLVIDGGKGQLEKALEAKEQFPGLHIEIISIAKSRVIPEAFSNRAVAKSPERIFTAQKKDPIELQEGSICFQILTHLRNEAHRFAITQHRRQRDKDISRSNLETIKGIGPKTTKRIYEKFSDLNALKKASIEELTAVKGINHKIAEEILLFLRSESKNNG